MLKLVFGHHQVPWSTHKKTQNLRSQFRWKATRFPVLLLFASVYSFSQVHIREQVEVTTSILGSPTGAPGGNGPASFYTPCDPPPTGDTVRLAVFYGDSVSLYHITCPSCPNHHMSGCVTQGSEYVRLTLNRPPGPGGEINGNCFHFREAWGYSVTVHLDQHEPLDYALVKITMQYVDFPPPNLAYVEIYVVNPNFRVMADLLGPTIVHGTFSELRLSAGAACQGVYPDSLTFVASVISGSEWGCMVNPVTHDTSTTLSGLSPYSGTPELYFIANGLNPDSAEQVRLRFTASASEVLPLDTVIVVTHRGPRLVVLDPPLNAIPIGKEITAEPRMPSISAKAQLQGYDGGPVFFSWQFSLAWKNPQYTLQGGRLEDRVVQCAFSGSDTVQNADTSNWTIPWGELIRGGDIDTLYVTARAGDTVFHKTVINPYRIRGNNPSKDTVKAGLSVQEQVIVFKESRWAQFENSPGFPLYGRPRGYGVMQLDTDPATDQQVWHWRENRAEGIERVGDKYREAVGLAGRIRTGRSRSDWYPLRYLNATDLTTDEQLWKEMYQRYRGGSYWRWYPDRVQDPQSSGYWVAEPQMGHTRGDDDWQTYQDVIAGHPPNGW